MTESGPTAGPLIRDLDLGSVSLAAPFSLAGASFLGPGRVGPIVLQKIRDNSRANITTPINLVQVPQAPVGPAAGPSADASADRPRPGHRQRSDRFKALGDEEPDQPGNRDLEEEDETPTAPIPQRPRLVKQATEVRPLPGSLDAVPVFNSNSPEVVRTEGILLSTFPTNGMRVARAHLNFPMQGRFDIFSHHISRADAQEEGRTLFQGIMVYNPGPRRVRLDVLEAASYISRFDAPYKVLPAYVEDAIGSVYSGAGSRVAGDVMRGRQRAIAQSTIELEPRQAEMLMNLPIPVGKVTPSSNTRSTLFRLRASAPVYLASLAMFSPKAPDGSELRPSLRDWQTLLVNGGLSGPRDVPPSLPDSTAPRFFYGRVAGVARGSSWETTLTDRDSNELRIPFPGGSVSYAIATLTRGTLGTSQNQSAPMLVRYPDTAYFAHGNYGVHYRLTLPLANRTGTRQRVALMFQTPIKEDEPSSGLSFFEPPESRVFYRGPIRFEYLNSSGYPESRIVHVVQHRGEQGQPLLELVLPPGDHRTVKVDFIYPPDATPPHVLTVQTQP